MPPTRFKKKPRGGPPRGPGDSRKPDQPGGMSFGTQWLGGPLFTDPFNSRRAPTPFDLIEKYTALIYSMVSRNREAVSRIPMRLYADGSRAQGAPRRACDPVPVGRSMGMRMARKGLVSPAAVTQVYEVRNHFLLDALERPDPGDTMSRRKLIGLIVTYMDVVGQAFLVPEGDGWDWRDEDQDYLHRGRIEYLWILYSQYVTAYREPGVIIPDYFQYFRDRIPRAAALWFRHSLSLRDAYGSAFSPTYAGDLYSDQEFRYTAIWDQMLGIGPRPNLIASAKDPNNPPGEAERKRFEQDMNRRHAAGNAGGLLVLNGAYDITPVNYAGADLAAKEISEYDRNNLAGIFGQPPTYYTTDTNLANLQAADEQYARNGVEPRCDTVAEVFTRLAKKFDPRLFFKFDPALPEDDESRAKVIDMKLKNGSMTINQANEEERWPAVPWGDEPWLPQTLKQPSMLQQLHEQSLATQQAAAESQKRRDDFELSDGPGMEMEGEGGPPDDVPPEQERALRALERTLGAGRAA